MASSTHQNFHLPLSSHLQARLKVLSSREGVPATAIARRALDEWLRIREREAQAEEIARYAAEVSGSQDDLDRGLEEASIEAWLVSQRRTR
jgi:hypothetical protein